MNTDIPETTIIRQLIKDNKKLLVEIGKNSSYIEELKYTIKQLQDKLSNFKAASKEEAIKVKKEDLYKNILSKLKKVSKLNKSLEQNQDILLCKLHKYETILAKNNLLNK